MLASMGNIRRDSFVTSSCATKENSAHAVKRSSGPGGDHQDEHSLKWDVGGHSMARWKVLLRSTGAQGTLGGRSHVLTPLQNGGGGKPAHAQHLRPHFRIVWRREVRKLEKLQRKRVVEHDPHNFWGVTS